MHHDRWLRIESVFNEIVDLPAGEPQSTRLAELTAGDDDMRRQVQALLEQEAALRREDSAPASGDPHVGLRLHPFAVGRLVARGGMAAVYEGQRVDGAFAQRVAVKIMDLRLSDPALVARFKAERQILAGLEHPSVTRLLDGGVTALGEPYLVMEFIEGQPIDRYCDERQLGLDARVALFGQVCEAVTYAHRTLVLHRDLKPSNVLVTNEGRAKVVDFGTATLLQPDRLATTTAAPLTPAYASPEQLTGAPVGTASDQYSLGIVLFELLTGGMPFGERPSLLAAMERALAGTTTTAPHAAVTAEAAATRQTSLARLRRTLSSDLGTIVTKALAPDPAARYASVQHFADDLTRWSRGQPILGRPASRAYLTARFLQRHWVASSLAAVLALALAAATGVSVQQARLARAEAERARVESQRAQVESQRATAFNGFLTRMLSAANPLWTNADAARAGTITVREVLDGAGQLITTDAGLAPEVEADIRLSLGATYAGLNVPDAAREHLEQALALARRLGLAKEAATAQRHLTTTYLSSGNPQEAERQARPALEYARAHSDADPESHFILANDLSLALSNQGRRDEGRRFLREAADVIERHGIRSGGAAAVVHNLGVDFSLQGDHALAEKYMRRSVAMMESMPSLPAEHAMALRTLADFLLIQERHTEALELATRAAAEADRVWPDTHPHRHSVRMTLGNALTAAGQPAEGRDALRAAIAGWERIRPPGHIETLTPLIGLATAERALGHLAEALAIARRAERGLDRYPTFTSRGAAAREVGLALRAMGREAEARVALQRSYEVYRTIAGEQHPNTRAALARLDAPGVDPPSRR